MLDASHSDRFRGSKRPRDLCDVARRRMYIGSISSWYRVLRGAGETRERRRQATHPARIKPELAAAAPGEVWSWDITKLLGPQKWTYFYLYVVSRRIQPLRRCLATRNAPRAQRSQKNSLPQQSRAKPLIPNT